MFAMFERPSILFVENRWCYGDSMKTMSDATIAIALREKSKVLGCSPSKLAEMLGRKGGRMWFSFLLNGFALCDEGYAASFFVDVLVLA